MSTHRPVPELSPSVIARLRHELVAKREALLAAQLAGRAGQRKIGDPESEQGDVAEQIVEQDAALRLGTVDAALLADVERALAKIDAGSYGVSEESGAAIPVARLEAVPWARRTAEEEGRRR